MQTGLCLRLGTRGGYGGQPRLYNTRKYELVSAQTPRREEYRATSTAPIHRRRKTHTAA